MWRHFASNMVTLLIVAVFLFGGIILWGQSSYKAAGPLDSPMCLRVERGSNVGRVSKILESQGVVKSGTLFRLGMDYSDKAANLKAGSYLVPPHASMADISDLVTRGGASSCGTEIVYRIGITRSNILVRALDPATNKYVEKAAFDPSKDPIPEVYNTTREEGDVRYRIAMAEGVTSWQVIDALKQIDILTDDVVTVPAEGTLAPDSYEVREGDTRADLVAKMVNTQNILLAAAWEGRADDLPIKTPEEALILASIIEKETGIAGERRQVASVFINRLNRGMKLQTDPTVIYGITKGEGILGRGLRRSELRKETPWNTYVIKALPPTPIANPGRASLEAAMNPDSTNYVFFVADGTGGHAFAATLNEHNANVAKWRKIEAERANN